MTIHNQWGTKPDPVTGLSPYALIQAHRQVVHPLVVRVTDAGGSVQRGPMHWRRAAEVGAGVDAAPRIAL